MVLQRDAPLQIWGWANPGERVRVQFRGHELTARAAVDGRWSANLAPQAAGGPDDMVVQASNTLVIKDVLVGDVWLASGQSNMEFPLVGDGRFGGVADAERELVGADFPRLRLFLVRHRSALKPETNVAADGWMSVTPATVRGFSAIAYLFGRELHQRYGVPLGLIESSWGGTPAETWTSTEGLREFPRFAALIAMQKHAGAREIAAFAEYLKVKNAWYGLHGKEDRGRAAGRDVWASPVTQAADWPTTLEPQPWPIKAVKDFDGTMWFRRNIDVAGKDAGRDLTLHLSHLLQADTTYFNGERVGATDGENPPREYRVPGRYVKRGANLLVVRLAGEYAAGEGYVGMLGEPAEMFAEVGRERVPLAGLWSYATGPDLSGLPEPPPLAAFNSRFPQAPALLFNGMIAPLTSYRIRGVVWYQGEANVSRAAEYRRLFPALIKDWRAKWGYEFPFLFVQLAGYGVEPAEPAESARAELREAQAVALTLPNTAMATAIDVGNATDIHPRNKQAVAHRLALGAESLAYGERIVSSGPTFQLMRIEEGRIRIRFGNLGTGLTADRKTGLLRGFAISGADGSFVRAQAHIEGRDVVVSNSTVQAPLAVRYDWGNTPDGNLFNNEGLPALPFRTDAPTSSAQTHSSCGARC